MLTINLCIFTVAVTDKGGAVVSLFSPHIYG